jgi:hypothetical protein
MLIYTLQKVIGELGVGSCNRNEDDVMHADINLLATRPLYQQKCILMGDIMALRPPTWGSNRVFSTSGY